MTHAKILRFLSIIKALELSIQKPDMEQITFHSRLTALGRFRIELFQFGLRADFLDNKSIFEQFITHIQEDEELRERKCLRHIISINGRDYRDHPEVALIKESVELHFGAIWMWNNIAQDLVRDRKDIDLSIPEHTTHVFL